MRRTRIAVVVSVLFFSSLTSVHADIFSTQQGDMWLGGGFSFSTTGMKYKDYDYDYDIDRLNLITISPIMRFFPVNHLLFGPKFSWTGMFSGDYQENLFSLGAEIGCAFNASVYPYFFTGPHAQIAGNGSGDPETLFGLPFTVGIMVPVAEHLAIQLETGLSFGFDEDIITNTFSIGFGLCGLGEKTAVSALNSFTSLFSLF